MMISIKLIGLFFVVLLLSSCASLSKDECLNADWFDIGFNDGQSGYRLTRLSNHNEACAEYHIKANGQRYAQGREQGLKKYCTLDNALQEGLSGKRYRGVCPNEIEHRFIKEHRKGMAIYELQKEVDQHQRRITSLRNTLDSDKNKEKLSANKIERYEHELLELRVKTEEKQKRLYYMKGQADISM